MLPGIMHISLQEKKPEEPQSSHSGPELCAWANSARAAKASAS